MTREKLIWFLVFENFRDGLLARQHVFRAVVGGHTHGNCFDAGIDGGHFDVDCVAMKTGLVDVNLTSFFRKIRTRATLMVFPQ